MHCKGISNLIHVYFKVEINDQVSAIPSLLIQVRMSI